MEFMPTGGLTVCCLMSHSPDKPLSVWNPIGRLQNRKNAEPQPAGEWHVFF